MDILLLAIALATLLFAGAGLSLLLWPKKGLVELLGLSFLFGAAIVSMTEFCAGLLLPAASLRWAVMAVCACVGICGLWRRRGDPFRFSGIDWLWYASSAVLTSVVSWLASHRTLGWDGLLVFEMKARLAFLNSGVVPADYFLDPSRAWSHPSYPLLLPLTECWLYLWLGRADQQLVKILFPMFFAAALAMLFVASRQSTRRAPILLLPLMTVPLIWIGNGSASSGYADFPLAVYYLAAIVYLLDYRQSKDSRALLLAGVLMACACWLKREGAVLWFFVVMLGVFEMKAQEPMPIERRSWLRLAGLLLPGLLVILLWRLFIRSMNLDGGDDFLPVSLTTLTANAHYAPAILRYALSELINLRYWGIVWPVSIGAAIYLLVRRREFLLPAAVLGPVLVYGSTYLFSGWDDPVAHARSSYPRLLIQVVLVTLVMLGSLLDQKNEPRLAANAGGVT